MDITLINPSWYFEKSGRIILSQNLGLGYIASCLRANGHEVRIIDALAEGLNKKVLVKTKYQKLKRVSLSYKKIVKKIKYTDLIGITAPFINHAKIVEDLSAEIKKSFPETPIILCGVYPSTIPTNALGKGVDYVIRGEGEIPIVKFTSSVKTSRIKGLVYRKEGKIIDLGASEVYLDLDKIPFPARDLLPMKRYLHLSPRISSGKKRSR
jgi:radical SAM superfamily enzyme YgiQ (UPF0313 family)